MMIWQKKHKKVNRRISAEQNRFQWLRPALVVKLALFAAGVGVMLWVVNLLSDPQTMPLRSVQVESEFRHVSADKIRESVARYSWQGFLRVDIEAIKTDLLENPWIASVEVDRVWPDELYVKVVEHKAFARWESGGVINESGEVFYPEEGSYPDDLVLFFGAADSLPEMVDYYKKNKDLISGIGMDIAGIGLDDRRSWYITLKDGAVLVLGRTESEQRLQRFVRWYPHLDGGEVERVDLRYSNGFSIQWRKQTEEVTKA